MYLFSFTELDIPVFLKLKSASDYKNYFFRGICANNVKLKMLKEIGQSTSFFILAVVYEIVHKMNTGNELALCSQINFII